MFHLQFLFVCFTYIQFILLFSFNSISFFSNLYCFKVFCFALLSLVRLQFPADNASLNNVSFAFSTGRNRGINAHCEYLWSVSILIYVIILVPCPWGSLVWWGEGLLGPQNPPQRRQWQPTPVLLPGESHGWRSLGGCSPWGRWVGHDWATSLSLFTFMHWRRKWQPTPVFLRGESQGWGSLVGCRLWGRTVGHDWSDLAAAAKPSSQKAMTVVSAVLQQQFVLFYYQLYYIFICTHEMQRNFFKCKNLYSVT